jgi:hypothetical protein
MQGGCFQTLPIVNNVCIVCILAYLFQLIEQPMQYAVARLVVFEELQYVSEEDNTNLYLTHIVQGPLKQWKSVHFFKIFKFTRI